VIYPLGKIIIISTRRTRYSRSSPTSVVQNLAYGCGYSEILKECPCIPMRGCWNDLGRGRCYGGGGASAQGRGGFFVHRTRWRLNCAQGVEQFDIGCVFPSSLPPHPPSFSCRFVVLYTEQYIVHVRYILH
jgi:hypothetical protein